MKWEKLSDALGRLELGTPPPDGAGLFGASIEPADCKVVILPVAWDATVSYGIGTAKGPSAVMDASHQLDLEDPHFLQPYKAGITMLMADDEVERLNGKARSHVERVLRHLDSPKPYVEDLAIINSASKRINELVESKAKAAIAAGQIVGVLGGDHSSPYGLIKALADTYADRSGALGILHFDAHHDLRVAYEGFEHSHASIMYNVTHDLPAVTKLVQVGIRDYSKDERAYAEALGQRAAVHYGYDLFRRKALGESWGAICSAIIAPLPEHVYISFDIDGLDPSYCPSTGTPVPGGLSYDEAIFLVATLAQSGKKIVGFDLCEVAPAKDDSSDWDANVGARILYKLCGAALFSQGVIGKA